MPHDPQELLARWASDEMLDPYGPMADKGTSSPASKSLPANVLGKGNDPGLAEDLDRPFEMTRTLPLTTDELTASTPVKRNAAKEPATSKGPSAATPAPQSRENVKSVPEQNENAPETTTLPIGESSPPPRQPNAKRGGGTLMALGQLLAYIGVLGLTIGSTFVLWGYFGDKPHYAPMGWLVVTVGQMLLFLGILTLVSGGIEQTTSHADAHFAALNEQILRLEQAVISGRSGKLPLAAKATAETQSGLDSSSGAAA